jgi:NAD(P)H-dependent FMN reductase
VDDILDADAIVLASLADKRRPPGMLKYFVDWIAEKSTARTTGL